MPESKQQPMQTRVTISAMFPDLPSARAYQSSTGVASNTRAAIAKAFRILLTKAKGKHIHEIKAHLTITREPKDWGRNSDYD